MQGNLFSRVDIYSVPANLQCSKEKCQSRAIIEGTFSLSNANGNKSYIHLQYLSLQVKYLPICSRLIIAFQFFPILCFFFYLGRYLLEPQDFIK